MRTTQTIGLMAMVAVLAGAGTAGAQVRPTPPAPPAPPAPKVAPVPPVAPAPRLDLLTLDDFRLHSLDDLRHSLDLRSVDLAHLQDAAREASRDAMDQARLAMDHARLEWQDRAFTFTSSQGDGNYSSGKDLLGRGQYEQAITRFDRVIAQKGSNVDGATYWKAFAQYKLGRTDDALATIAALRRDHAQSRYLADAKILEADVRKQAGQPVNPDSLGNDEMKVLAINGIKDTDPERAVPLLEGVLNSTNSLRVKKQALFVLASMTQPRAYQILLSYAKGAGNPDLQLEAIRYVSANRNKQTSAADLMQIYQSTQDTDVKLAIISALRSFGDRTALTGILTSGSSPMVVRTSALNGLAGILSPQDIATLYEKETNKDLRMQMVSVLGSMQAIDQLNRVIKTEKEVDVRRRAVRTLGNMKSDKTGQMLTDLYGGEQDVETKRTIISALASQNNAEGLVAIARKESTLALKTEIVRRLSDMAPKSKVAADYLMEIIK